MNPKCTLPEEKRAEALEQLGGWCLSREEEDRIRDVFPQYLFFRNEFRDDGWNVSDPVRVCTCTACGESFEAVRGNYAKGKLHHEKCNCPHCGATVEGIAAHKYGYDMKSLERWVKVAIARAGDDGQLLIIAGNAHRKFNWDNLTGDIELLETARYYFGQDGTCEWKLERVYDGCTEYENRWVPTKTVGDPFQPAMYTYDGSYSIIGLGEALPKTHLKYCQIMQFFERRAYADLDDSKPARAIVKYLAWACVHPQIEMAVRFGLEGAVEELITGGKKNRELLDWNAKRPDRFLRMSRPDAKIFLAHEMNFEDLRAIRRDAAEIGVSEYLEICDIIGGRDNMRELTECARLAGAEPKTAARYVSSLQPVCPTQRVNPKTIIRTWKDYLSMAGQLGYDLSERTVAMPKNLRERHDAASEILYTRTHEEELKKYRTRRRQLEKLYRFSLGGYCILIPTGADEIIREGRTLHHCVGGYADRHMKGKTTILFLRNARKPGRPFLTIELEKKDGQIRIRQIHGYKNEGYTGAVDPQRRFAWFLEPWLAWVNAGSERDRAGNPVLPEAETEETTTEVEAI